MPANKKKGVVLIESLVALAILGLVFIPFISSLTNLLLSRGRAWLRIRASRLAQEGIEATYNLAGNAPDWQVFTNTYVNNVWHPVSTSGQIGLEAGEETSVEGKFNRQIKIELSRRDDQGNVADEGNYLDSNTIKVVSSVSWLEGNELKTVRYTTYLIEL